MEAVQSPSDRDLLFGVVLGAIVIGLGFSVWRMMLGVERAQLAEENALLEEEIWNLHKILEDYEASNLERFELRVQTLSALGENRGRAARFVGAVEQAVPTGVWLTRLQWFDSRLTLTGRTDDPAGAAEVMDGLRRSGCFSEITLAGVSGPVGERTFTITGKPVEPCEALGPAATDPFAPPVDPEARPDLVLPALYRWDVRAYDVVALVPGTEATLQDPDGGTHVVRIGNSVGRPPATVSFITDDQVLLTQDRIVDEETRKTRSSIIELPLERAGGPISPP